MRDKVQPYLIISLFCLSVCSVYSLDYTIGMDDPRWRFRDHGDMKTAMRLTLAGSLLLTTAGFLYQEIHIDSKDYKLEYTDNQSALHWENYERTRRYKGSPYSAVLSSLGLVSYLAYQSIALDSAYYDWSLKRWRFIPVTMSDYRRLGYLSLGYGVAILGLSYFAIEEKIITKKGTHYVVFPNASTHSWQIDQRKVEEDIRKASVVIALGAIYIGNGIYNLAKAKGWGYKGFDIGDSRFKVELVPMFTDSFTGLGIAIEF